MRWPKKQTSISRDLDAPLASAYVCCSGNSRRSRRRRHGSRYAVADDAADAAQRPPVPPTFRDRRSTLKKPCTAHRAAGAARSAMKNQTKKSRKSRGFSESTLLDRLLTSLGGRRTECGPHAHRAQAVNLLESCAACRLRESRPLSKITYSPTWRSSRRTKNIFTR